jgi:hypothetical protein
MTASFPPALSCMFDGYFNKKPVAGMVLPHPLTADKNKV